MKLTKDTSNDICGSLETKNGRYYTPAIRQLYYQLLSSQIPASKVSDVITSVIECFLPKVDVSNLKLPKERCAGYMRCEELTTIGMAHKAHVLCKQIKSGKQFNLNSDGTTLNQHKINGVAINGMVLSLNEVPDGKAESILNDIEGELAKLRQAAYQLKLPNANAINWTLFASSTSDSASTQKSLTTSWKRELQLMKKSMEHLKKVELSLSKISVPCT